MYYYCGDDDYYDDDDEDRYDDDDDTDYADDLESCYVDTTEQAKRKGKKVLRNELHNNSGLRNAKFTAFAKPKVDKGKGVLRHEESSRIGEGSSVSHGCNTTNITRLSEGDRDIFRPGPEEQTKLEWSLNHVFFEGLEIFGEDSDSELSDCCDACMIEIDHSKQIS